MRDALNPQLVPDSDEVVTLKELDLVGHKAGAEALISRVLEVPAGLRLLHKLAQRLLHGSFGKILNRAPDLEVLGGIAVLVLGRALVGTQESALGREGQLESSHDFGESSQDVADGGIDNRDAIIGGIGEVATTRRVCTTPEVALRLHETRETLIDRRSINDTDGLLGAVGELKWLSHD